MIVTALVLLFFGGLGGGFVYLLSSDKGGGGKKTFVAKVDLVRPNLQTSRRLLRRRSPPSPR